MKERNRGRRIGPESKMASPSLTKKRMIVFHSRDGQTSQIEDHPELPEEPPEKTILKKTRRMPIEIMLKSKIVRETLNAKGYDLNQVEMGVTQIDEDLWRLLA